MDDAAEQVAASVARLAAAWTRGDLDSVMACYEPGQTPLYISGGRLVRGADAIRADLVARFRQGGSLGTLALTVQECHALGGEHVFALGHYRLTNAADTTTTGLFTLVLRRHASGGASEWRIVVDHPA